MYLQELVAGADVFFLIFARVLALLSVAPLLSSAAFPGIARAALAIFTTVAVFPWVQASGYPVPSEGLSYGLLVLGEVLLGLFQGFFLTLVYAVFQMAGQLFSVPMGFGASEVFDPLAQIEIPLLGQLFNLMAMFVFITVQGFQQVFLINVYYSFRVLKAVDLVGAPELAAGRLLTSLSGLFEKSFLISLPVLGTLLLVSVTLGLLGKAAPQMNLLMIGFPISLTVGFLVLTLSIPFLADGFGAVVNSSFFQLRDFLNLLAPPVAGRGAGL